MATGEFLRGVLLYSIPGASEVLSVFHWLQSGGADDEQIGLDLTGWAEDSWGPRWADIASSLASITQLKIDVVNADGTVARDLGVKVLDVPGIINSSTQPGAVSTMLFVPTLRPKTRGRKFVPGVSEQGIENGFITPGVIADLAILALPYFSDFIGLTGTAYIPGVMSTVTATFEAFLKTVGFNDIPDYQRRRRPDRGS